MVDQSACKARHQPAGGVHPCPFGAVLRLGKPMGVSSSSAHLHRAEGDVANARYWYRRAGREASTVYLEEEFAAIAAALLASTLG